jgi:hypothetical protein
LFRHCHARRFSVDELNPTGRASGVAAAGVQHIDAGVLLDRQHETLA